MYFELLVPVAPDLGARLRCNKIPTTRVASSLYVSSPSLLIPWAHQWAGVSRPCPSRQDISHCGCQVPLREQAGVPEGDEEGSLMGD